jgi:hypothetical protein
MIFNQVTPGSRLRYTVANLYIDPELLDDLARVIYRYILEGKYYGCLSKVKDAIVQYGLGRFIEKRESMNIEQEMEKEIMDDHQDMDITEEGSESMTKKPYDRDDKPMVRIEEPLAIISIIRWLERQGRTLYEYIRSNVHHDKGSGFESVVLIALTKLLQNPTKLGRIFKFHGSTPDWASLPARIVARSPTGVFVPFDILNGTPLFPSNGVTFFANSPNDVRRWLQDGEAGWCVPSRAMGPDLITRVQLDDGRILLLTIQVKCWFSGNKETLKASTTTEAIRSLIPSNYFSSIKVSRELYIPNFLVTFYSRASRNKKLTRCLKPLTRSLMHLLQVNTISCESLPRTHLGLTLHQYLKLFNQN